jgi:hypothetical protein
MAVQSHRLFGGEELGVIPLFIGHVAAVLLAIVALWSLRHELRETAASGFDWALPPALATVVAAILLIVSPGKRIELWTVGIGLGFVLGLAAGMLPRVNKDFALHLVRVARSWDGAAAAAGLVLLALARLVSSDLTSRQSGGYGVLGAAAAFIAAYLVGRVITLYFYKAPRSIHYDMVRGRNPHL